MPAVPTLSFEIINQTSIVMVISVALRHCAIFITSPAFTLVGYLVALLHDFVRCYYPMSENPGFDLSLRKQRDDEGDPSHVSELLQKQQPDSVRPPGVSVPDGGAPVAARRRRRNRRGVRRTKAGVGRSRYGGRGYQSTAGRTDNDANDDDEGNDGKCPTDRGGNSEEDSAISRYFACPFYKFEPAQQYLGYRHQKYNRYSDVKRHILHCHTLSYDDAIENPTASQSTATRSREQE